MKTSRNNWVAAVVIAGLLIAGGAAWGGTVTWDGSDSTSWNTGGNWSDGVAPVNGDDVVFTDGNPTYQPSNNDISGLKLRTVTFANGTFTGPLYLGGNALELDATAYGAATTLANANTTAGRNVTISNNIVVTGNQQWSTPNANGVTIIAGNLSGSGDITVTNSHAAGTVLPALRLSGDNSGYTGSIRFQGDSNYKGIMLMNSSAMIGGSIRLDILGDNAGRSTRASLWLNGAGSPGPYTFGIGTGAGEVGFYPPVAGEVHGLHVTGGHVAWDPGNGGNYSLPTSNPLITIGPQATSEPTPYRIDFGSAGQRLILQGTAGLAVGYSTPQTVFNILYALSDDGTGRPFNSGDGGGENRGGLVVLNAPATGGSLSGNTTIHAGALAVSNMNQIFNGNLNLSGGVLVLDNVSWADFVADRSSGYGTGANQWQTTGGGFAARGAPLVIDTNGTTDSTFDRNFLLGARFKGTDGLFYADQSVTLARNTTLTAQRTIRADATGPGLTGGTADGVELRISGNLSGPGSLALGGNIDGGRIGEIVLAGANSWDGAPSLNQGVPTGNLFNLGPGGLAVGGGGQSVFARFASPSSLPTGGGVVGSGDTLWLGAAVRGVPDFTSGFLFTGDADGEVYDLTAGGVNRQVVIGATRDNGSGTIGATDGKAILRNAPVVILGDAGGSARSLGLLARPEAELVLGDGSGTARLIPAWASHTASATNTQDTLTDRTGTSTLVKRGEGTVVLGNLAYTDLAGNTLPTSQFAWRMGRAIDNNSGATAYFDGAVRGLSFNDPAAGSSNSLANFPLLFQGAVYEIDNSGGGSGIFTANIGQSAGAVYWPTSPGGSGGFAAYGGPVTVTLNSGNTLTWQGDASSGIARAPGYALIMGSRTANATLTWSNPIALNGAVREIRVYDNPNSTGDKTILSGILSGTGASGITTAGDGVLVLSGANTYAGETTVSTGSLYINGSLDAQSSYVTVNSGGTLGGTGTISRAVSVQSGGTLAPGDYEDHGTLTIAANTVLAEGARYAWSYDGSSGDSVQVNGTLTLPATATVTVTGTGDLPSSSVLFSSSNPLAGASGLSGWIVEGAPSGATVEIQGTTVILKLPPKGTVILMR